MKRSAMVCAAGVLMYVAAGPAAGLAIPWYTFDGGGGMFSAGGVFEVSGTIGQPDAVALTGGDIEVSGGFWVSGVTGGGPGACGCGDLDGSGLVDLGDFSTFADCFGLSGPSVDCTAAELACADLDGDSVVSLNDFSRFSSAFGLPPVGSPPDCQ